MGNKIGRRRQVVDDKFTRPQGLYEHRDIDHKKLRKLILGSKLAPCYPGEDDCGLDLEECPICFMYYPSLNRSRCCMKGICTECFLQMKPPHSTCPRHILLNTIRCPFCKTSNYAVEYRGLRTKEEKNIEQLEEQKVIEAQIRMQQQELLDTEERRHKKQDISSSSRIITAEDVEYPDVSHSSVPSFRYPADDSDIVSPGPSISPVIRQHSSRQNREAKFDLDLEDIMVMEAIWLSIQQEGGGLRNRPIGASENSHASHPMEASPSGGLACTVAALAERQHASQDLGNASRSSNPAFGTLPRSARCSTAREVKEEEGGWSAEDHGPEAAEAGPSYASSDVAADAATGTWLAVPEGGVSAAAGCLLPESFEEQMMLAMALSLAEARSRTNSQEVTLM